MRDAKAAKAPRPLRSIVTIAGARTDHYCSQSGLSRRSCRSGLSVTRPWRFAVRRWGRLRNRRGRRTALPGV